jgi:hypothetical protein
MRTCRGFPRSEPAHEVPEVLECLTLDATCAGDSGDALKVYRLSLRPGDGPCFPMPCG